MLFRFWPRKSPALDGDGRFRQSPHVLATRQGDEIVLFDTRGERYYTLNAVGARVWALLDPGATRPEVVNAIRREYSVPADRPDAPVEHDVTRLLRDLWVAGLVIFEPRTTPAHW